MLYNYEIACKEAGCSEEKTAEIRRMFDAEYKRLNYEKVVQANNNVVIMSTAAMKSEDMPGGEFDIDADIDIEAEILHKIDLENLRMYMSELPVHDREFLFACFEDGVGCVKAGEKIGLNKNQAHYRKVQLIEWLRGKMV